MPRLAFHEDLTEHVEPRASSDRAFGLVFAAFFLLVGGWPLVGGGTVRRWALGLALAFLVVAAVRPALLHRLNLAWALLGRWLGRITNPIVAGVLFYGVFGPIGVALRLLGRDLLRRRREPAARSYWIERRPPGPPPESLTNQF